MNGINYNIVALLNFAGCSNDQHANVGKYPNRKKRAIIIAGVNGTTANENRTKEKEIKKNHQQQQQHKNAIVMC